jgi:PPP family 3-phenylpropionic acid transporter
MSRNIVNLSLFYAFIYMSTGAFFSYIGLYYTEMGIGQLEIGVLTSVGAIISLFAQPYWGLVSDRSRYKNRVLILCTLCSALTVWLIAWSGSGYIWLLLSTAVFSLFQVAINPLSDAITLELSSKGVVRFSSVRTIGSVGYALISVAAGWMFSRNIHTIFPVTSLILGGCFLIALGIPKVEGHQSGKNRVKLTELFKNKTLVYLYIYALILATTLGFFFSFHAIYSKQQGISMELIGTGIAIGSFSQFPFLIFFQKIYERFGIRNILLFSGLIHALRWILYAYALSPATVLLLWMVHGGTYILFYLCLAEYVNTHVLKELKASGQMVNSVILLGISKIIGGILGGWFSSRFGFQSAFVVCFAVSLLSVVWFYFASARSGLFTWAKKGAQSVSS